MRLDLLAPGPAAALITSAIEQPSPDDERTAADIATELGFLPLALDQAAAYIAQARIPLPRYLELLREHPIRMYAAVPPGGQAQRTIACLWDITLQAITQADPAAARLLAYWPATEHPNTVLYQGNLVARYRAVGRDADAVALKSRCGSAAG
jgi:hypothetical protein